MSLEALLEMPFDCKDRCTHAKRLVAGFDSSPTSTVIDPAGHEVTWGPKVRESEGRPIVPEDSDTKPVLATQESPV